jgi:predicted RNase H-like HicB family nuclease
MDNGGWVLKVMGREVWIEAEPETDMLVVSCPDLPGGAAFVNSLDEAILRMEALVEERTRHDAN